MSTARISPPEIVKALLESRDPTLTVIIGPASNDQQQAGVVSLMNGGLPTVERYLPIQWMRAQCRCLAPTLAAADELSWKVNEALHDVTRTLVTQPSTGDVYLVHQCEVTSGPSMHYDSQATWETLLFAEVMIGSEAVETA